MGDQGRDYRWPLWVKEETQAEGREVSQAGTGDGLDGWRLSQILENPLGFTHVGNPQEQIFSSHFKTTGAKLKTKVLSARPTTSTPTHTMLGGAAPPHPLPTGDLTLQTEQSPS